MYTSIFNANSFKTALSFIFPIKLGSFISQEHHNIEVYLDKGQYQLIYNNAIYSYGLYYKPFIYAFNKLELKELLVFNKVLVLGAGMGSIPFILFEKYGLKAAYNLVDIDKEILQLCKAFFDYHRIPNTALYHENAASFVQNVNESYDLICVDIFKNLIIPEYFTTLEFLKNIHDKLNTSGMMIYNFIANDHCAVSDLAARIESVFSKMKIVTYRTNHIFIATK
jgi:predicted membrane-bound spermidine synthase